MTLHAIGIALVWVGGLMTGSGVTILVMTRGRRG